MAQEEQLEAYNDALHIVPACEVAAGRAGGRGGKKAKKGTCLSYLGLCVCESIPALKYIYTPINNHTLQPRPRPRSASPSSWRSTRTGSRSTTKATTSRTSWTRTTPTTALPPRARRRRPRRHPSRARPRRSSPRRRPPSVRGDCLGSFQVLTHTHQPPPALTNHHSRAQARRGRCRQARAQEEAGQGQRRRGQRERRGGRAGAVPRRAHAPPHGSLPRCQGQVLGGGREQ